MANKPEKIVLPKGDLVSNRACATRFVELVRELPEVRTVLWDTIGYMPLIWTVLDAAPWDDELADRICEAQAEALNAVLAAHVGFRLVNLAAWDDRQPEDLLPCDAEVLWERQR